jgi:RimJ/RimL family protein N-acetyltransferase
MSKGPLEAFETARLLVRAPREGDGPELNAAILETWDELHASMPWAGTRPTVDASEAHTLAARRDFLERRDLQLRAYLAGSETLVLCSGLHRLDWTVPSAEIGYWCRARFQRRGFVSEAVKGIVAFGFETLGLQRIAIHCDERNERSRRVAERVGFTFEGTMRNEARDPQGGLRNTLVFSMLPGEFVDKSAGLWSPRFR